MGLWRGKKGSSVFYRIANSNSQQKQGIRERNYEPANPQTAAQASQRLKLLPAQRVYGAIKPIIERAWQGIDYGAMTRQAYLKRAISMTEGYPYLDKESNKLVPGKYQISKGTLMEITTDYDDVDTHVSSLYCDLLFDDNTTLGALSSELIDENDGLLEGDQLTIVVCATDAQNFTSEALLEASYQWHYKSIFLDTLSTDTLGPLGISDGYLLGGQGTDGTQLGVHYKDKNIVASAIILSRLSNDGLYLRSTAQLFVPDAVMTAWTSQAQKTKAVKSYQRKDPISLNTNWPVDDSEMPEGSYQTTFAISGLTGSLAVFNGRECMILASETTGDPTAVYTTTVAGETGEILVGTDGLPISANVQMEDVYLTKASVTALASLPSVTWRN